MHPEDYQAVALAPQTYESLGRSEAVRDAASCTVKATEKTLEFNPVHHSTSAGTSYP